MDCFKFLIEKDTLQKKSIIFRNEHNLEINWAMLYFFFTRTIYKGLATYLLLDLNVIFSPDFSIFLQITQTQALVGTHATHIH